MHTWCGRFYMQSVCYLERIQLRNPFLLIPKFYEHFLHMFAALTWRPRDEKVKEWQIESEIAFNQKYCRNNFIRQKLYKDVAKVLYLFVSVTTNLYNYLWAEQFHQKTLVGSHNRRESRKEGNFLFTLSIFFPVNILWLTLLKSLPHGEQDSNSSSIMKLVSINQPNLLSTLANIKHVEKRKKMSKLKLLEVNMG